MNSHQSINQQIPSQSSPFLTYPHNDNSSILINHQIPSVSGLTYPPNFNTSQNQTQFNVLIEFNDADYPSYWKTEVSPDEFRILNGEIHKYNFWIDNYLKLGEAPECSYVDKDSVNDADLRIFVENDYRPIFGQPGERFAYEWGNQNFTLFNLFFVHIGHKYSPLLNL